MTFNWNFWKVWVAKNHQVVPLQVGIVFSSQLPCPQNIQMLDTNWLIGDVFLTTHTVEMPSIKIHTSIHTSIHACMHSQKNGNWKSMVHGTLMNGHVHRDWSSLPKLEWQNLVTPYHCFPETFFLNIVPSHRGIDGSSEIFSPQMCWPSPVAYVHGIFVLWVPEARMNKEEFCCYLNQNSSLRKLVWRFRFENYNILFALLTCMN